MVIQLYFTSKLITGHTFFFIFKVGFDPLSVNEAIIYKLCNLMEFVAKCNVSFFPGQGARPGFFHDDKSQKKGMGLLLEFYVYLCSNGN